MDKQADGNYQNRTVGGKNVIFLCYSLLCYPNKLFCVMHRGIV